MEIAVKRLHAFSFVGLFEKFEESIFKLFNKCGFSCETLRSKEKINFTNPKVVADIHAKPILKKILFPLVEKDLQIYESSKDLYKH